MNDDEKAALAIRLDLIEVAINQLLHEVGDLQTLIGIHLVQLHPTNLDSVVDSEEMTDRG